MRHGATQDPFSELILEDDHQALCPIRPVDVRGDMSTWAKERQRAYNGSLQHNESYNKREFSGEAGEKLSDLGKRRDYSYVVLLVVSLFINCLAIYFIRRHISILSLFFLALLNYCRLTMRRRQFDLFGKRRSRNGSIASKWIGLGCRADKELLSNGKKNWKMRRDRK